MSGGLTPTALRFRSPLRVAQQKLLLSLRFGTSPWRTPDGFAVPHPDISPCRSVLSLQILQCSYSGRSSTFDLLGLPHFCYATYVWLLVRAFRSVPMLFTVSNHVQCQIGILWMYVNTSQKVFYQNLRKRR